MTLETEKKYFDFSLKFMIKFQDKMTLNTVLCLFYVIKPFKYRSKKLKMSNYGEKTVKLLKIVKNILTR